MPHSTGAAGEGFAFLAADLFVLVADTLALVRFRRANVSYLGSELADLLLVRPFDDNGSWVRHLDGDAGRRDHQHAIGETDRQLDSLVLGRRLVADPFDFQTFLVALGDALDHVGDDAARQSMQRARETFIIGTGNADDLGDLVHLDFDEPMIGELQLLAFRSFYRDLTVGDLDFDASGNGHRLFADARHNSPPYQTVHNNSPPSRWARALRSLMTPRLVLMTLMPKPSSTGLSCSARR